MRSIEDQLRDLARHADDAMPWIDPREVIMSDRVAELHRPEVDLPKVYRRSRLPVAVAAAVLVILLLGVPLLSVITGSEVSEGTPAGTIDVIPPTTVAESDAQPLDATTSVNVPPQELNWRSIEGWSGQSPQWISAYPGGGYVASGIGISPRYSLDGESWTEEPFHEDLAGVEDVLVEGRYALVNSADRHEALEELDDYPSPLPGRGWIYPKWERLLEFDGERWQTLEIEGLLAAPPVTSGDMVLVQGEVQVRGSSFDRYWLSVDGGPFAMHSGPPGGDALLNSPQVFSVPSGGFGIYWETGDLLLTADGIQWEKTADFFDLTGERIGGPRALAWASYGEGLIAQRWSRPFAWYTTDGVSFQKLDQPAGAHAEGVRYLVPVGQGAFLIYLDSAPQFWWSSDLQTWEPLSSPDPRPAQAGPDSGRVSVTRDALFYWYPAANGEVVMQIAGAQ